MHARLRRAPGMRETCPCRGRTDDQRMRQSFPRTSQQARHSVTDQWWRERPADKTATKAAPCRFPRVGLFSFGADVRFLIRMSLTGAPRKSAGDAPPELSTAEGDKGIVGERGAIGAVRGSNAEKRLEKLAYDTLGQVARNENQPRSMIVIGPAIEARGRVEDVLHAMHDNRCVRHFRQLYDALQAQKV